VPHQCPLTCFLGMYFGQIGEHEPALGHVEAALEYLHSIEEYVAKKSHMGQDLSVNNAKSITLMLGETSGASQFVWWTPMIKEMYLQAMRLLSSPELSASGRGLRNRSHGQAITFLERALSAVSAFVFMTLPTDVGHNDLIVVPLLQAKGKLKADRQQKVTIHFLLCHILRLALDSQTASRQKIIHNVWKSIKVRIA